MHPKYSTLLILFISAAPVFCQPAGNSGEKFLEDIIVNPAIENEQEPDLTNLLSDLETFTTQPLNINAAGREELEQLFFLNEFQLISILDYRKNKGKMISIYELLYLPGFTNETLELLSRYTYCGDSENSFPGYSKQGINQSLLIRWQRVLENQSGYTIPDSSEKNHYLGSPDKLLLKYRLEGLKGIDMGLTLEKDAGEEFMQGSNPRGFDFNSAYMGWKPSKSIVRQMILGDYQLSFGQGLLVHTAYAPNTLQESAFLIRRKSEIRVNRSTDENQYLRGFTVEFQKKSISANLFLAGQNIDANPIDSASFSAFVNTGYHGSMTDLKHEDVVFRKTTGFCAAFDQHPFHFGIQGVITSYDKSKLNGNEPYQINEFQGNLCKGISMDFRYTGKKIICFGENGMSFNHWGFYNGFQINPSQNIMLTGIFRNYQPGYFSPFSALPGKNSINSNELGYTLQLNLGIGDFNLKSYLDIYRFPTPKYQINTSTSGNEIFAELSGTINSTAFSLRFKRRNGYEALSVTTPMDSIVPRSKNNFRLTLSQTVSKRFSLQSRVEISSNDINDSELNFGVMIYQDFQYEVIPENLNLRSRFAWFKVADYDCRIYAYEADVLYAYNSTMFYGEGWRSMIMLKWQPAKLLTLWMKYSLTCYPGRDETGSGLNSSEGPFRSDIKLQCFFRLRN